MKTVRLLALLAACSIGCLAQSPDLVIAYVYGGGGNSNATFNRDFVVLFNRGSSAVSLGGKSLQYASATGTGNFSGNTVLSLPSVSLGAGKYFLVTRS